MVGPGGRLLVGTGRPCGSLCSGRGSATWTPGGHGHVLKGMWELIDQVDFRIFFAVCDAHTCFFLGECGVLGFEILAVWPLGLFEGAPLGGKGTRVPFSRLSPPHASTFHDILLTSFSLIGTAFRLSLLMFTSHDECHGQVLLNTRTSSICTDRWLSCLSCLRHTHRAIGSRYLRMVDVSTYFQT